jgi:hypothetical protein
MGHPVPIEKRAGFVEAANRCARSEHETHSSLLPNAF